MYNRVPKCGSTTTLQIIDSLKRRLHFNVLNDIAPGMTNLMESDEQELGKIYASNDSLISSELVRNITNLKEPMLYIRHVFFIDFPRYGFKDPLNINIVRDPVARFISKYYYNRFGFENPNPVAAKKWRHPMPDDVRAMTLDECVRKSVPECAQPSLDLILYFCGHSE